MRAELAARRAELARRFSGARKGGSGDVTPGPGHSPLDEGVRSEATVSYKDEALPPGVGEVVVIGWAGLAPGRAESQPVPRRRSRRRFARELDSPYWKKRSLPRHRAVLRRYFARGSAARQPSQ